MTEKTEVNQFGSPTNNVFFVGTLIWKPKLLTNKDGATYCQFAVRNAGTWRDREIYGSIKGIANDELAHIVSGCNKDDILEIGGMLVSRKSQFNQKDGKPYYEMQVFVTHIRPMAVSKEGSHTMRKVDTDNDSFKLPFDI